MREERLHQQFVNGGIELATATLIQKEKETGRCGSLGLSNNSGEGLDKTLINQTSKKTSKPIDKVSNFSTRKVTKIENEFQGTELRLFVKMSRNHRIINGLIRFYKFLKKSIEEETELIFYGGETEEKN